MKNADLTAAEVRRLLSYNPNDGQLRWKHDQTNGAVAGSIAGSRATTGYIRVTIFRKSYAAHRLAWIHAHGHWPTQIVDHINGVRHDNRACNLRLASPRQNAQNKGVAANNTSGSPGVRYRADQDRWVAYIKHGRRQVQVGSYRSRSEAEAARAKAKQTLHTFQPTQRA
jgi:hypothetical protein